METSENNHLEGPKRRFSLGQLFKVVAWLLPSVIAIVIAVFFYVQWQSAQEKVQQGASNGEVKGASEEEINDVVKELSKIVLLPEGETPALSTIKDKSALTENQDFFREAENGDQVLVFQQAKKAFIYRPSTKKLINLAPINIADVNAEQVQPKTEDRSSPIPETKPLTVEVRNGTSKQGLTYDFEEKLLEAFEQAEIIERKSAARASYGESLVVVMNLTQKAQAQQIANDLGFALGNLPEDEDRGEADVLIILGADQL